MRLWSLNPVYLDQKGLTAAWREGLLAQAVLLGETKGYKNHPQLIRFKQASDPLQAISNFLGSVFLEAEARGYKFDKTKLCKKFDSEYLIPVTEGQLFYEFGHLQGKLTFRNKEKRNENSTFYLNGLTLYTNHAFDTVPGDIEPWEKTK